MNLRNYPEVWVSNGGVYNGPVMGFSPVMWCYVSWEPESIVTVVFGLN
jgi:hypothetical protein